MLWRLGTWGIAVWLGVAAAPFGEPALAAGAGDGSKNFSVPSSVPNYFSNEAGPMIGGAAETRRGPLYSGQAVAARPPRQTATAAIAAPVRQHIAMAVPRGRLIRGRHRAPTLSHHAVLHGRAPAHAAAQRRPHVTHVASRTTVHAHARSTTHTASKSRTHTASKTKQVAKVQHRARS